MPVLFQNALGYGMYRSYPNSIFVNASPSQAVLHFHRCFVRKCQSDDSVFLQAG